jgi:hypothetical protein
MTRRELADAINASPVGVARHLYCDEERVRRWEAGEASWPSADYRKTLWQVTGCDPRQLGFTPPCESSKGLRELRQERGWSLSGAVRALVACATDEERKGLPGPDTLRQNWIRWESGRHEPDGGRSEPFYKPIIARMFGVKPDMIWPGEEARRSRIPRFFQAAEYRDELESRRQAVHDTIGKLEKELAYLDAVLAIPVPASD